MQFCICNKTQNGVPKIEKAYIIGSVCSISSSVSLLAKGSIVKSIWSTNRNTLYCDDDNVTFG